MHMTDRKTTQGRTSCSHKSYKNTTKPPCSILTAPWHLPLNVFMLEARLLTQEPLGYILITPKP